MTKPQLEWEVIDSYEKGAPATVSISLLHQTQTTERDPWCVKVKFDTGQGESEDFPSEEGARAIYNQLLASFGVDTEPEILEPENVEQLFATWWTRLHHANQRQPAQEEVELAFVADPAVRAQAQELMALATGRKGWIPALMRSCLAPIVVQEKAKEMQQVRGHANFGRFA